MRISCRSTHLLPHLLVLLLLLHGLLFVLALGVGTVVHVPGLLLLERMPVEPEELLGVKLRELGDEVPEVADQKT